MAALKKIMTCRQHSITMTSQSWLAKPSKNVNVKNSSLSCCARVTLQKQHIARMWLLKLAVSGIHNVVHSFSRTLNRLRVRTLTNTTRTGWRNLVKHLSPVYTLSVLFETKLLIDGGPRGRYWFSKLIKQ